MKKPGKGKRYDLSRGRALKAQGIERALDHDPAWTAAAQKHVLHLCETQPGREMRGEEISAELLDNVGRPPHHNALGGMGSWYNLMGLVIVIDHEPMRLPRSHARSTPLYRLVHPRNAVPKNRKPDPLPLQEAAE